MSTLNAARQPRRRRIVLLPVDARPVVRQQVVQLVATADIDVVTPPTALLGHFRVPADCHALAEWLQAEAPMADGFVISLDMLVYGGLVPSRFVQDDLPTLLSRLDLIPRLKVRFPHKPVYVFLATMRISNNNINAEEKLYWADYGELIWRWSFYADKFAVTGDAAAKGIRDQTSTLIPIAVRDDYTATRKRNFAVALAALGLVGDDGINCLILPQDDTAAFGFNIAERRELERLVAERGLADVVRIYPGADEVAHTLCAYLVCGLTNSATLKVFIAFSDPDGVGRLCARYEDRPILQSIDSQLAAAGAVTVEELADADVMLAIHTQGAEQGDWAMQLPLPTQPGIAASWWLSIAQAKKMAKPIALLDLAYANGGDPAMMVQFAAHMPFKELAAYAGWNTASNSIGSLLAQCSLARWRYSEPANEAAVCLRLVEDALYQSVWRQKIRNVVDETVAPPATLASKVADMFIPAANHWLAEHGLLFRVTAIRLPWQRTFEIDIDLAPYRDAGAP